MAIYEIPTSFKLDKAAQKLVEASTKNFYAMGITQCGVRYPYIQARLDWEAMPENRFDDDLAALSQSFLNGEIDYATFRAKQLDILKVANGHTYELKTGKTGLQYPIFCPTFAGYTGAPGSYVVLYPSKAPTILFTADGRPALASRA